jgi:protein phosphatase 2C family protein 2/3
MTLFSYKHIPLNKNTLKQLFEGYEGPSHSHKSLKYIKGYAANTHQGTVRNYNEDRTTMVLNMNRPNTFKKENWPNCSVFGIYDGHGGSACADYLRDNLHKFVVNDPIFIENPKQAIFRGFEKAENEYLSNFAIGKNRNISDRSGSCALVAFIIGKNYY